VKKIPTFETHIDLKIQAIYVDKIYFYQILHILEGSASGYIKYVTA
jgi:hypothetical protein